MPDELTFEEVHLSLLQQLDNVYAKLRKIHGDEDFLNRDAPTYKEALERFEDTEREIFALKNVWQTGRDLMNEAQ